MSGTYATKLRHIKMKLSAPIILAALFGAPAIAQEPTSVSAAGDECMKQWEHDCNYDSDCCPGLNCLGYGPYGDTTMCNVPRHLEQSFTKETSDDFKPILADDAPQVEAAADVPWHLDNKEEMEGPAADVAAAVLNKFLRGAIEEDAGDVKERTFDGYCRGLLAGCQSNNDCCSGICEPEHKICIADCYHCSS